jgi:transcriptional regulator with XRE-family HTH domain
MPVARKKEAPVDPILEALGERLRVRRKQCGLSQIGLAELAGVDPAAIPRIEKGIRGTGLANLIAISKVLACPPGWLTFGEGALPAAPTYDPRYGDQRRRAQ